MDLDYGKVKEKMTMPSYNRKETFEIIEGESPLETVAWFVGIEYAFRKILPTRIGKGTLSAYNKLIGVPTEKAIDGLARGVKRAAGGPVKAIDKRIPGYAVRQAKRASKKASKAARRAAKAAARETKQLRALGRKGYIVTEKVAQKGTTAAVEAQQTIGRIGGKLKKGGIKVGKGVGRTGKSIGKSVGKGFKSVGKGLKSTGGKVKGWFKPSSAGRAPGKGITVGASSSAGLAGTVGAIMPAVATVGLAF